MSTTSDVDPVAPPSETPQYQTPVVVEVGTAVDLIRLGGSDTDHDKHGYYH